jgi:hypothetical protein
MRRILKLIGYAAAALLVVLVLVFFFRSGPLGPIPGGELSGEVVSDPVSDWSFSDGYRLIAVETRPGRPHSVTTVCFVHEGQIYVPASDGADKRWTRYLLEDPPVRLKIGDRIYPGRATRVSDEALRAELISAARGKYPRMVGEMDDETLARVWVFRVDSAP